MKLKRDIYSTFNPQHKYANAGDEVKIIGQIIVQGPTGDRFAISAGDILEEGESVVKENRVVNQVPSKKQHNKKSVNQTLF